MARQPINIGSIPNDGTGDKLRISFNKVNQNFGELYADTSNNTSKLNDAYAVANAAFGTANTASQDVYGRTVANAAYDHANSVAISANNYAGQMANAANSLAVYSSPAFVVANAAYNLANTSLQVSSYYSVGSNSRTISYNMTGGLYPPRSEEHTSELQSH